MEFVHALFVFSLRLCVSASLRLKKGHHRDGTSADPLQRDWSLADVFHSIEGTSGNSDGTNIPRPARKHDGCRLRSGWRKSVTSGLNCVILHTVIRPSVPNANLFLNLLA